MQLQSLAKMFEIEKKITHLKMRLCNPVTNEEQKIFRGDKVKRMQERHQK